MFQCGKVDVNPNTHTHTHTQLDRGALRCRAGIGISIGKVALYVAGGGFHPEHSLPVVLDVGCNRAELVEDKFYLVGGAVDVQYTGLVCSCCHACGATATRFMACISPLLASK